MMEGCSETEQLNQKIPNDILLDQQELIDVPPFIIVCTIRGCS